MALLKSRPKGPKMSVGKDERLRFQRRREALELDQRDVAERVGVTPAAVHNFEKSKSGQVYKEFYAAMYYVLFGKRDADTDAVQRAFVQLVQDAAAFSESELDVLQAQADLIKKSR